jgi:D-alanine-D-alanine ligase
MGKKIRLGILFGGRSSEHEVSLQSARSVIDNLDRSRYEAILIGIDKDGKWYLMDEKDYLINPTDPNKIKLSENKTPITMLPYGDPKNLILLNGEKIKRMDSLDVIFPLVHGTYGEDGTLQGFLEMSDVAYVGADVIGSAMGMDKEISKILLKDANIAVPDFQVIRRDEWEKDKKVDAKMGLPVFIKPANLGSSVGITKVEKSGDLKAAIENAFQYDDKVIIDKAITGREIECAVLGLTDLTVSKPGEIIPKHAFYSYEAKYLDAEGARLVAPVELGKALEDKLSDLAKKAFRALNCKGMARVDFFVEKDTEKIYINEINTIPGFTKISMYPKLFTLSGIPYADLINKLVDLAIERQKSRKSLKTTCDHL